MAKELDASLLSIWKELCIVFNQMSMIEPRLQDVELSKETSNNDHITLNYEKNESWKDAEKIVSSLSTESIQSLYELSKANLTNLNMHLAERRRFAAKFTTGVISVIGGGVAIARAFGLLNFEDIILVVFSVVLLYPACLLWWKFLGKPLQSKWQALELSTCLQTILAFRQSGMDDTI